MLLGQLGCFLPVVSVMGAAWGLNGVWLAFPASSALALLISAAVTVHVQKQLQKREGSVPFLP